MAMRSLFSQIQRDDFKRFDDMTLAEKLRTAYKDKNLNPRFVALNKFVADAFWLYLALTCAYTNTMYTVDDYFSTSGEWMVYYMRVLATFIFINIMANWLCVKCYHSIYQKSRETPGVLRPDHVVDMDVTVVNRMDDEQAKKYAKSKRPLPWHFCERCQLDAPPRSHHCDNCNVCILKRDHHCFFIGTCIGHFNQRYFTVLSLYLFLAGLSATILAYTYLTKYFFPTCESWDLFLPVTAYRCLLGEIPVHMVLLLSHLYLMWIAILLGGGFFFWMVILISLGKTSREAFKQLRVATTSTVNENFREVFGDYWGLNFLFPANIIFRQRTDGSTWNKVYQY